MLKLISILYFCIAITSCNSKTTNNCTTDIKFPSTKYRFPIHTNPEDSGFMYITYKDSLSARDSFIFAFSGYHFFRSFDESNLSLKPTGNVIVRISSDSWGEPPFVLKMTCNEIILKLHESGRLYPVEQLSRLTSKEQFHYNLLERNFPMDKMNGISESKVKYFDSLKNLYPELLSSKYYRQLKEKAINPDTLPMKYTTYKKSIRSDQFEHYIDRLNEENFWNLPHQMNLEHAVTDGGGYVIEIHTLDQFRLIIPSNCPEIAKDITKVCQEIIDLVKPKDRKITLCN